MGVKYMYFFFLIFMIHVGYEVRGIDTGDMKSVSVQVVQGKQEE